MTIVSKDALYQQVQPFEKDFKKKLKPYHRLSNTPPTSAIKGTSLHKDIEKMKVFILAVFAERFAGFRGVSLKMTSTSRLNFAFSAISYMFLYCYFS